MLGLAPGNYYLQSHRIFLADTAVDIVLGGRRTRDIMDPLITNEILLEDAENKDDHLLKEIKIIILMSMQPVLSLIF